MDRRRFLTAAAVSVLAGCGQADTDAESSARTTVEPISIELSEDQTTSTATQSSTPTPTADRRFISDEATVDSLRVTIDNYETTRSIRYESKQLTVGRSRRILLVHGRATNTGDSPRTVPGLDSIRLDTSKRSVLPFDSDTDHVNSGDRTYLTWGTGDDTAAKRKLDAGETFTGWLVFTPNTFTPSQTSIVMDFEGKSDSIRWYLK